ncbi:lantibiotic dehydratase [Pantoea sp. CCBC3-3-1]|uniref:lantibiotic dehydratase n=1 Tax=Pantoea sp. CCBC3-3-1 TaxID=2490851 RepID=UPI0011BEC414|nr:lantibiotic dehydratase [Pantoea sp. CCBC3-3-1]
MMLFSQPGLLVAPFILLRIAGLPTQYVSKLPDGLLAVIQQQQRQEPRWQQLRQTLIESLYAHVALPAADNVRNELIRYRRHLYNGRPFLLSEEVSAWLAHYDDVTLAQLAEWQALSEERRQLKATFSQCWQQVSDLTREALTDAADEPAMCRALTLASPRLLADLAQNWQAWPAKKRRRVERSLFAYMIRAAGKISPFSTFASFILLPLANSATGASLQTTNWQVATTIRLNRSIALALREALYSQHLLAERDLPLSLNPSLQRMSASQLRGHFYRYEKRRGLLWNEEQQFALSLEPQDVDAILTARSAQRWSEWHQHFVAAGIAPQSAERLLRKLIRKDVLRPQLQWSAHHPAPLAAVLELLPAELTSEALSLLPELPRQLRKAKDTVRIELLAQAQQTLNESWQRLTSHQMPEIRNLVYEDAWSEGIDMTLPDAFVPDVLARVARVVAKRASLSLEYLWLRQAFLQRYGEGGVCEDIGLFLQESWQEFIHFSQQLLSQPAAAVARLSYKGIDPAALRLPVTLFLQLEASDVGELHQRHGKVVINNAYSRIAWQLARTTLTDDGGADARRDQLKLWLQQVAAPALPLTFSFSGESSNLQAQARLAQHHLCLNEPQQVADDLVLAQIHLCHDAASGLLHFKDQQGQALQPFYLGAATPMIAWGTKYLLTVLAEPVQIGRPAWSQLMASEQDDDFRHAPRLEEDNCVLIRETWWLRTSRIFREFSGQPVVDHPMLLLELLLKQGIPPDSYVNGQYNDSLSWQAFNNDKIRKPMWCRLGNTHCLDQLLLLARKADWLVFREALPAPENSWMQMQENNYVAEIHSEMVISGNNFDLSLMFPEQEKHNA